VIPPTHAEGELASEPLSLRGVRRPSVETPGSTESCIILLDSNHSREGGIDPSAEKTATR
jgi:hypothetical protein